MRPAPPRLLRLCAALALAALALGGCARAGCGHGRALAFVCGAPQPEDLAALPGERWLIASRLSGGGLTLIDTATRRATPAIIAAPARGPPNCPAPLDARRFASQGLALLPTDVRRARLFVVGHGAREAIEIFDVDAATSGPRLTWAGCLPAPAGARFNGVAATPDGRVFASDFLHAGRTAADLDAGRTTGAVYVASHGAPFGKLPASDLPGPNGL